MTGKKYNPVIIAKGEDLGNGYCLVQQGWLPKKIADVADKYDLVVNGTWCVISSEFIENPWRATAVYDTRNYVEYTEKDL